MRHLINFVCIDKECYYVSTVDLAGYYIETMIFKCEELSCFSYSIDWSDLYCERYGKDEVKATLRHFEIVTHIEDYIKETDL